MTGGSISNKLFQYMFFIHFILITILVIILTVRGAQSVNDFRPKEWYMPVLASTGCAGIIGFTWQALTRISPARTIRVAFWLSPILTCLLAVLLICIGTPVSTAASVIAFFSSLIQSFYACWVNPRLENTIHTVTVSIVHNLPRFTVMLLSIIVGTISSAFMLTGIGGATAAGSRLDSVFIFLIIASLTWAMQIIRNTMQVAVAHIRYLQLAHNTDISFETAFKSAIQHSMGSICIGSILVPSIGVIRAIARTITLVAGDVDEFLFSCADCCGTIASRIIAYGNRWGFVHVGVYNKGIVQASVDTWESFKRNGAEKTINSDLTSSFCFLTGVAGGSMCALVGGIWAFVIHRSYATGVTLYTFLAGYLVSRVAMVWVQASVSAYYVTQFDYPQNHQFDANRRSNMPQNLQRPQVPMQPVR